MTEMAIQIAQDLLKIQAVTFSPQHPFTWASDMQAPIYTDNRKTIAYPKVREHIAQGLASLIQQNFPQATVIAGVATAGIAHAALAADRLNLPMSYVRSKPKDHGTGQQIEGQINSSDQVVLIDDLISTGGSVLKAVKAVQQTGATVLGVAAIFSYELPDSRQNFAAAQMPLKTLTSYHQLVQQAQQLGDISKNEVESLQRWRDDPWHWLQ
ncbi:orotate phosphoribosyltransferase [Bombilactobacillus folatiphilus]|uniref:Orotate phosphoribosyltransferase n=1 Tax=Bombilactobacillus folatiphilus TaxID=2923362 RepID=A0ABY4P810_9LACO|nr:orotate phosphoribosyltransferase [Bombilactobacillus folatiphilus]UQS81788.1 orotate phosphoribosyltransferase [Bombilactobacillus folatiphilus]